MMFLDNRKGETQWATKAARKIKKRGRSRTLKNRNKSQKTSLIGSQKESLDRGYGDDFIVETPIPKVKLKGFRNHP
jgi:hypothetical protein